VTQFSSFILPAVRNVMYFHFSTCFHCFNYVATLFSWYVILNIKEKNHIRIFLLITNRFNLSSNHLKWLFCAFIGEEWCYQISLWRWTTFRGGIETDFPIWSSKLFELSPLNFLFIELSSKWSQKCLWQQISSNKSIQSDL